MCWPPSPPRWSHQSQSALLGWLAPHWASPSSRWSSPSASCPSGSLTINPPCCPSHIWWWRWKLGKRAHRSAYVLMHSSKGSVLAQLHLSPQCRWLLRFPECRTKEPRPENMCNMRSHWWSTTHRHKNEEWASAHPQFSFYWLFSSFKLKCILVAPHWKLFGSRVTQITKK